MGIHRWDKMTKDEKLEIINPVLENLKEIMISDKTRDCSITTYYDDKPEIRNGVYELISIPYVATDTIEIKISRVKNTW